MTRVIVHAGFHKTGTSSLQTQLARLRGDLKPWFDYYGAAEFMQAGAHARIYAQRPFFTRRLNFRRAFEAFLDSIPDADTIILSRETFSGNMPGHRDWRARPLRRFAPAAIPLCREVRRGVQRRFGKDTQIEFLFTTREREAWIQSVYGHLVRSIHLTEDFETFRAGFPGLIDLTDEAQKIGRALSPCPIHIAALEDHMTKRHGPAGIVLDLVGVPQDVQDSLPRAKQANTGQSPDMLDQFLEMNRSGRSKAALKRAKDDMIKQARKA